MEGVYLIHMLLGVLRPLGVIGKTPYFIFFFFEENLSTS